MALRIRFGLYACFTAMLAGCQPGPIGSAPGHDALEHPADGVLVDASAADSGGAARDSGWINVDASSPAPSPAPCEENEVMGPDDLVWSLFKEVQLWPVPPVTGTGDLGRAIQFVADSAAYPRGVRLGGIDESNGNAKDYVISDCPHRFEPVGGDPLCTVRGGGSTAGPIYLRYGPAEPRGFFGTPLPTVDCPLIPEGTYYINFRATVTPRGNVSSQFVIYGRSD